MEDLTSTQSASTPTGPRPGNTPRAGSIRIGMDQNIGASPKQRLLEDAYFAETMITAGGQAVTLTIVAHAEIYSGQDHRVATVRLKSHRHAGTFPDGTIDRGIADGSTVHRAYR